MKSRYLRKNQVVEIYGVNNPTVFPSPRDQDLAEYLGTRDYVCPMFGKELIIGKELGRGVNGAAFELTFVDEPSKKYVVKKLNAPTELEKYSALTEKHTLDPVLYAMLNVGLNNSDKWVSPYIYKCKMTDELIYDSNVTSGTDITIDAGYLSCGDDEEVSQYSEYLISAIVGKLKENGKCIHFVECFEFAMCIDGKRDISIYNFMELVNGITLNRAAVPSPGKGRPVIMYLEESPGELLELRHILIQILFAIQMYQSLGISHNDLHSGNVMLTKPKKNEWWNGKRLDTAEYYSYIIDGYQIYVPVTQERWIVKIIDWGMACKYPSSRSSTSSKGVILNDNVIRDSYDRRIPNEFVPSFDILRLVRTFAGDSFVEDVIREITSNYSSPIDDFYLDGFPNFSDTKILPRPYKKNLVSDLFKNSMLFEKYRIKPNVKDDKIVVVGEI